MDKKKYIDESWKEQASQEKGILSGTSGQSETSQPPSSDDLGSKSEDQTDEAGPIMDVNFLNYITSLGYQAMIFMGEVPNPVTNEVEKNLHQAKFLIDTLAMLKEKTVGNLNDQEKSMLEGSVYELQLRYVQIAQAQDSSKDQNP